MIVILVIRLEIRLFDENELQFVLIIVNLMWNTPLQIV